jgi:site-specific recombinase
MKKSTVTFLGLNVLTMLWFLGFVLQARSLALAEERDAYDVGDSLAFLLYVAPALLLCVIADMIWAGIALLAAVRRRGFQQAVACAIVLATWLVVLFTARALAGLPSNPLLQRTAAPPAERTR